MHQNLHPTSTPAADELWRPSVLCECDAAAELLGGEDTAEAGELGGVPAMAASAAASARAERAALLADRKGASAKPAAGPVMTAAF